ncbi:hypothetical protein OSB04_017037 [Centaurea solstitialis]|uniref:GAG-pre-integrase domain-containing protein n=1 Tax=Centaurea solstitialis TaxID=347529 RepID=A0AA38WAC8_9ASTR|nr:hypothetical protein OSB04_017037 [Centaurea solstitialis]
MQSPRESHARAVKQILRYICGTLSLGIRYERCDELKLLGYSDSSRNVDADDGRSTTGHIFFLGKSPISWCSQKQDTVALSSCEVEFMAATSAACQAVWLRELLAEVTGLKKQKVLIRIDNKSTIALSKNPVFHGRSKHIHTRFHFIRERVENKQVEVEHVAGDSQVADSLTKALARPPSSMADKTDPKQSSLHPAYSVTNIQQRVRFLDGEKIPYPSWVNLFWLLATGFDVLNHIDGSPPPEAKSAEYSSWKKPDAVVLQWIYAILSEDLLVWVLVSKPTAYEAWKRVQNLFLNNKGSRAAALQHELTKLTLAAMPSLEAYCQRIRELADQLTAVDTQRVLYLVRGLPREYDVVGSLLNQTLPPWENACDQLQSEARWIAARETVSPTPVVAAAITNPPSHPPNRDNRRASGTRRDNNRNNRSNTHASSQPRPQAPAQMPFPYWALPPYWAPPCPYPTQGWAQPWQHRSSISRPITFVPAQQPWGSPQVKAEAHLAEVDSLQPTQLADAVQALSMDTRNMDDQWYFDTGATSHVTNDPGKLSTFSPYSPIESISVEDGNKIPVLGTGSSTNPTPSKSLHLKSVLFNPNIIKNVISVRKFNIDNNTSIEFDPFGFSLKDFKNGTILSRHNSSSDLYLLTANASATTACFASNKDSSFWHNRLGHPGQPVMEFLRSNNLISCHKFHFPFVCHACQLSKHKRLPFSDTINRTLFRAVHRTGSGGSGPKTQYLIGSRVENQDPDIHPFMLDTRQFGGEKQKLLHGGDVGSEFTSHSPLPPLSTRH